MPGTGPDLALLLLGGYRKLVDSATVELAARGYPDYRPVHDFTLRAIAAGGDSASDLGRRMSVSKQAAAKTVAVLVARGYVSRVPDPSDSRRKQLRVTPTGLEVMREGESILDGMRDQWRRRVGASELAALESHLTTLVGVGSVRLAGPDWNADELA